MRQIIVALFAAIGVHAAEPVEFVLERGPHHRIVQTIQHVFAEGGGTIETITNCYTELATGMHRWAPAVTNWVDADATIQLVEGRGKVLGTQHKALFAANAADPDGLVDVEMADGQRLKIRTLGIAYTDPDTGEMAFIAQIRETAGIADGVNTLLFENAFSGLRADIRIRSFLHGIESDVILREQPPHPSDVGINPQSARLEVIHEILQSPQRRLSHGNVRRADGRLDRDTTIGFGQMQIPLGNAFTLPAGALGPHPEQTGRAVLVTKEVFELDGRVFFAEAIPYSEAAPLIEDLLPERQEARAKPNPQSSAHRQVAESNRKVPVTLWALPKPSATLAISERRVKSDEPGFVIDYQLLNANQENFTFYGTETYYVTAPVALTGQTTIEGGTVIKYRKSLSENYFINIMGSVMCKTEAHLPAVITSAQDGGYGQGVLTGTGDWADMALKISTGASPLLLKNLSIRYASIGIGLDGVDSAILQNVQFYQCDQAVNVGGSDKPVSLRNILIAEGGVNGTVFGGSPGAKIHGENITIDRAANLHAGGITVKLVNSIIARVSNLNQFDSSSPFNHITATTDIFTSNGSRGGYYLADHSLRNSGTDEILGLENLRKSTTYPPVILPSSITTDTVLAPEVPLDLDVPDKGYHYFPIDFCAGGTVSAKLTLTNGVTVAHYSTLALRAGSKLVSIGAPERPNRIIRYKNVQEQPLQWGQGGGAFLTLDSQYGQLDNDIRLRFSEFAYLTPIVSIVEGFGGFGRRLYPLAISDSLLRGVYLNFASWEYANTINLTNNVFLNSSVRFEQGPAMYNPYARQWITLYNNLFHTGCTNTFIYKDYGGVWIIKDNFFNSGSFHAESSYPLPEVKRNAYKVGIYDTYWAAHTGTNNVYGINADFVAGPYGDYYYPDPRAHPSTAALRNAGSRSAIDAGLAHFSTSATGVKDTGPVDIGFHFPAGQQSYVASTEFSGIQGPIWRYQRTSAAGIVDLVSFNNSIWHDPAPGLEWLWIASGYQIPGIAEDSIRTFVAPQTGLIKIEGAAYDGQISIDNTPTQGAKARIMTQSGEVPRPWIQIPEGSTSITSTPMEVPSLYIQKNQRIHFAVNSNGHNSADYVRWDPRITYLTASDFDDDGLPDYLEDTNGDNAYTDGHDLARWNDLDRDSDGDGLFDGYEVSMGYSPTKERATDNGSIGITVFTPLKN